jgi:hypothetical protein
MTTMDQEKIEIYKLFYSYNYEIIKKTIGDKVRDELMQETGKPHRVQYIIEHFCDGNIELYFNTR